jgi:hypothetical protein
MTTTASADRAILDPERQFLGCLMQLPLAPARRLLAGMRADDLADPSAALVLQLAIELLADDQPPAPVALYTHALATGRAVGEHRRSLLSGWIIDTYRAATAPVIADHLKTVVLHAAWRRAVAAHARRVLQAVVQSPTEVLRDLADDTTTADELWDRLTATPGTGRLGAVA